MEQLRSLVETTVSADPVSEQAQFDAATLDAVKSIADLELAARALVLHYGQQSSDNVVHHICILLDLILEASEIDAADFSLVHSLIEDLFDIRTIAWCEAFWPYLVSRESKLCRDLSGRKAPGTTLIRFCNSLGKRLSKSHDSEFSGKIAMFLARAFPLNEKSGLNIRGSFNTDNVTILEPAEQIVPAVEADGDTVIEETGDKDTPYDDFWALQAYFSDPTKLFDTAELSSFKDKVDKSLEFLSKHTMRSNQSGKRKSSRRDPSRKWSRRDPERVDKFMKSIDAAEEEDQFLPKWLTKRDLFELQLKDDSFQSAFLLQLKIVAEFMLSLASHEEAEWAKLPATNKSVMFAYTLPDEGVDYFTELRLRIRKHGIPLDSGARVDRVVSLLGNRDVEWQKWKLKNCPSFEKEKLSDDHYHQAQEALVKLRQPRKKFWHTMGTAALSKVWKIPTGMDKLEVNNLFKVPTPQEYHGRVESVQKKSGEADPNAMEVDGEKVSEQDEALISSLTWRGLRAAREQGYWEKFNQVNIDTGFGGLFAESVVPRSETLALAEKKRAEAAAAERAAQAAAAAAKAAEKASKAAEESTPQPESGNGAGATRDGSEVDDDPMEGQEDENGAKSKVKSRHDVEDQKDEENDDDDDDDEDDEDSDSSESNDEDDSDSDDSEDEASSPAASENASSQAGDNDDEEAEDEADSEAEATTDAPTEEPAEESAEDVAEKVEEPVEDEPEAPRPAKRRRSSRR